MNTDLIKIEYTHSFVATNEKNIYIHSSKVDIYHYRLNERTVVSFEEKYFSAYNSRTRERERKTISVSSDIPLEIQVEKVVESMNNKAATKAYVLKVDDYSDGEITISNKALKEKSIQSIKGEYKYEKVQTAIEKMNKQLFKQLSEKRITEIENILLIGIESEKVIDWNKELTREIKEIDAFLEVPEILNYPEYPLIDLNSAKPTSQELPKNLIKILQHINLFSRH